MEKIIKYFIEEKGCNEVVAKILAKPLIKYDDIKDEFIFWLVNREYKQEDALTIEGYSAIDIYKLAPDMNVAGVYNFMVTLRDTPEKAKEYILKGFPKK